MASDAGFVEYVLEQLAPAGRVRAKRMFGEYGLFLDGVFIAVICADQLFVKPTAEARAAFPGLPMAPPYEGAKDYILVEDIDDAGLLCAIARADPRRPVRRCRRQKMRGFVRECTRFSL